MSSVSRETLYNLFGEGERPTRDSFRDLIDSSLNLRDEGFDKKPETGLQIRPIGEGSRALFSFYRSQASHEASWTVGFGEARDQLSIGHGSAGAADGSPAITLDPAGAPTPLAPEGSQVLVGIQNTDPRCALDVNGVIGAQGRVGVAPKELGGDEKIYADGGYWDVTGELTGCHAYEVVAGVGDPARKRFALLYAIALNTYNPAWWDRLLQNLWTPRRPIRATRAYYSRRCDRLQLRWAGAHGGDGPYKLQIRTGCAYAGGPGGKGSPQQAVDDELLVQVYVTRLWFDFAMKGSRRQS